MCDVSLQILRLSIEPAEKMWGTICHVSHRFRCDASSRVKGSYCHLSTVDQGGDCVTVVPEIVCPLYKEKVSPVTEYQRLLEGFSLGQYNTDTESGSLTFLITRIS